jgi:hypothetical protein
VNTLVEEQKNKVNDAASHKGKRQQAAKVIPVLDLTGPESAAVQSQDYYESCLELSALFLGRG